MSARTVPTGVAVGGNVVVVVGAGGVVVVEAAPPTASTSCGFPVAASRELYRAPSVERLSIAKQ